MESASQHDITLCHQLPPNFGLTLLLAIKVRGKKTERKGIYKETLRHSISCDNLIAQIVRDREKCRIRDKDIETQFAPLKRGLSFPVSTVDCALLGLIGRRSTYDRRGPD